jgi:hypothetical protein
MARISGLKSVIMALACAAALGGLPSGGPVQAADAPCASCAAGGCAPAAGCAAMAPGGGCCKNEWCCPKFVFCLEKPPCIKFKFTCSKPLCDVCAMEGYGYYATCWRTPYPYPPTCGRIEAAPGAAIGPPGPVMGREEELPPPQKEKDKKPDR